MMEEARLFKPRVLNAAKVSYQNVKNHVLFMRLISCESNNFNIFNFIILCMESTHCANCGAAIDPSYKACPQCGQKTAIHRFTVPHFLHELFHAFTHADKSVVMLARELIIRPGTVLKEYIIEGKRKKYFNPFTFLIIVLGFSVFMNSVFHPLQKNSYFTAERVQAEKSVKKQKLLQTFNEKQQKINAFVEKRSNIVTFVIAPIMAFAFWLVFKGKHLNFAEHLVSYLILTSMLSLFSSICFTPLMGVLPYEKFYLVALGNVVVQLLYTCYAYKSFLNLKGIGELFLVVVANLLGMLIWLFLLTVVSFIYLLVF